MSESAHPKIERRGLLLVLSSPSGAGKTTMARRLLADDPGITPSISVTTRRMRPGEANGRDYHFIDKSAFTSLRDRGELLEWAEVFGNDYGTPAAPVMKAVAEGRDVLFDIDWQGARQLAARAPGDLVRVFILPPSATALHQRLTSRNQDPPEVVARRMAAASGEISHWGEYEYVLVNSDLEACYRQLTAILTAERLKRDRQPGLGRFTDRLLSEL